ncbi:MAG: hypothetical protein QM765_22985 [Myxococcales bacterium]
MQTSTEPRLSKNGRRVLRARKKARKNSPSFPGTVLWKKAPMATAW